MRDGTDYRIRGQAFNKPSLLRNYFRICPKCAAEDIKTSAQPVELAVYGRLSWNIASIRTCATHNTALTLFAKDPTTNEGHDFALIVRQNSHELQSLPVVDRAPSALENYLLARLNGVAKHHPWLDALDFHVAAKTCEIIGAIAIFGRDVVLDKMTDADWQVAGGAGFEIASAGESAIRAFLSRLQTSCVHNRSGAEGPQAVFGTLYKWIAFGAKDAAFDPVRDVMRRHIIETTPVGPADTVMGEPVKRRVLHSIHTAAMDFGAHPKRLRKILAAKGLLPAGHESSSDNLVLFDADRAQDVFDSGAIDGLTQKDLETYLGTGRVQAKILVDSGIVKPAVAVSEPGIGWFAFARKEIDTFLENLLRDAKPVDIAAESQVDIPTAAGRANCQSAEVVRLILDRKLDWVGTLTSKEKYLSVLVDIDEVKSKTRLTPLDGLTARQVEKALKTSTAAVRALIDNGILKTERRVNPINRCPVDIVPTADFEKFRATYVSLFELAKERGMHHMKLKKELAERNIRPAIDPELIHATFYRCEDINLENKQQ
jgi:hypothetical protein